MHGVLLGRDAITSLSLVLKDRARSIPRGLALLIGLYLATRLINLTVLPVYCDEAIHIDVAQHLDPEQGAFSSLQHGSYKIVLDWITAAYVALLPDPLVSARLVSVTAGMMSILALYLVGKELYSARIALLAVALYVISPLMLFHERMLLVDVILNTFGLYVLLFSLLCLRKGRIVHSLALGTVMGLAILSKLTGVFFLVTPLIVWALVQRIKVSALVARLLPAYCIVTLTVAPALLHPLRAQLFVEIGRKTIFTSGATSSTEWISLLTSNARTALSDLGVYVTWPVMAVLGLSLLLALLLRNREGIFLWSMCAVPVGALLASSIGFLPPRYFLLAVSPVLLCVAWCIEQASLVTQWLFRRAPTFWNQSVLLDWLFPAVSLCLLVGLSLESARFDYQILTDLSRTALPPLDRLQYIVGWSSGYGIPEAVQWLRDRAVQKQIAVITDGKDVIPLDGLLIYLHDNPRVTTIFRSLDEPVQATALGAETFAVIGTIPHPDFQPMNPKADLVASYPKPGGSSAVEIYAIPDPVAERKMSMMVIDGKLAGSVGAGGFTPPRWGEDKAGELIWVGHGVKEGVRGFLWSKGERVVELAFVVAPGPGRQDAPRTVELIVENQADMQTYRQQFASATTIGFPVDLRTGRNDFILRCLDNATVRRQPNGDTRPLLIRLDAIRVKSLFHEGQAGPADATLLKLDPDLTGVVGISTHLETPPWNVEFDGEGSFLWLGQGDAEGIGATLGSTQDIAVELSIDVAPGPGRPEEVRSVYLSLQSDWGEQRETQTFDARSTLSFTMELRKGRNNLTFGCLDEATVLKQPNGDTRPLLVLLREIRIGR